MTCPSCRRLQKPGALKCLYCGHALGPASTPIEAQTPQAPREEAPRRRVRRRLPLRSGGGSAAKLTIGGVVSVIVIAGLLGLRVCRTVDRVVGKSVVDETVTIDAGNDYSGGIEVGGSHTYNFEVTALDGPAMMAFGKVNNPDNPSQGEILALLAGAVQVGSGATQSLSESVGTGKYVWVVVNRSEKKSVRVKIKFHARG